MYEARKLSRGGDRKSKGKNFPLKTTAEEIGEKYGVTDRTVKNDADFSEAVDKVVAEVGEEVKSVILEVKRFHLFMGLRCLQEACPTLIRWSLTFSSFLLKQ